MAHQDPSKIRNVAVLGHRGTGKTSLVEALLHAAGATNRMGTIADGTDCDDGATGTFPGAVETCDGADEDCDDSIDEDFDVVQGCALKAPPFDQEFLATGNVT